MNSRRAQGRINDTRDSPLMTYCLHDIKAVASTPPQRPHTRFYLNQQASRKLNYFIHNSSRDSLSFLVSFVYRPHLAPLDSSQSTSFDESNLQNQEATHHVWHTHLHFQPDQRIQGVKYDSTNFSARNTDNTSGPKSCPCDYDRFINHIFIPSCTTWSSSTCSNWSCTKIRACATNSYYEDRKRRATSTSTWRVSYSFEDKQHTSSTESRGDLPSCSSNFNASTISHTNVNPPAYFYLRSAASYLIDEHLDHSFFSLPRSHSLG